MAEDGMLIFGGDILTIDPALPSAATVAVRDDKIVAVGDLELCKSALGPQHEKLDLTRRTLVPGFIDTHMHPTMLTFYALNIDLRPIRSIDDLKQLMAEGAKSRDKSEWVVGLDFEEDNLQESRLPNRHDLDDCCPDHPAAIIKHDGHMVVANSKALSMAEINAQTTAPDGGEIDREKSGTPTGVLRENAVSMITGKLPLPSMERLEEAAKKTFANLAAHGITSVGSIIQADDEGPAGEAGAMEIMLLSMLQAHTPIRFYSVVLGKTIEAILAGRETPLNHDGNRIGARKLYADGTLGSRTACMFEPFADAPDRSGFMTATNDELYRKMVEAHTAGLQIAIHAIGDKANRTCVDLYRRLLSEYPRADHRHRLEHASLLTPDTINDMAELGIVVSTQPTFLWSERNWLMRRIGEKRAEYTYPHRSLLSAGIKIGGASDAPVENVSVLHGMQCAVTRHGFVMNQALTPYEALRMYTADAAYIQHEDKIKGTITTGKRADMVVLSANPEKVAPDKIAEIKVEQTIIGGKLV